MAFKLFVSYSDKDRNRIEPLLFNVRNLQETTNGLLDIFFYEESKTPSVNTTDEIVGQMRCSNAVLYFHSNNSVLSEFVQNEIGGAVVSDKQVIIAKLDETPIKGMLQGVNYLDFSNPFVFEREIKALSDTVKAHIDAMQEQDTAGIPSAGEQADVMKNDVMPLQTRPDTVATSEQSTTAAQSSYTIEDWKMILAIAGVITLAYITLRSSK